MGRQVSAEGDRQGAGGAPRFLVVVALACLVLAAAGLMVRAPALPVIGTMPFAPALAGAAAATIALVLAWPFHFLLRRRPGYYDADGSADG